MRDLVSRLVRSYAYRSYKPVSFRWYDVNIAREMAKRMHLNKDDIAQPKGKVFRCGRKSG